MISRGELSSLSLKCKIIFIYVWATLGALLVNALFTIITESVRNKRIEIECIIFKIMTYNFPTVAFSFYQLILQKFSSTFKDATLEATWWCFMNFKICKVYDLFHGI